MLEVIRLAAKSTLAPVLYRYLPFNLQPARLAFYITALLDRAFAEPSYEVMKIFWPRLIPGGILLWDDCGEDRGWLAGGGYRRFCTEMQLPGEYYYGLGIIRKPE